MNAKDLTTIRQAIDAMAEVLAMTCDPNDSNEPHPKYSAADVFEAVCNLAGHVDEARAIVTTYGPPKIVVAVSGGCVTAVYCTDDKAAAEIVDFDDLRADAKNDGECDQALDAATDGMACIW